MKSLITIKFVLLLVAVVLLISACAPADPPSTGIYINGENTAKTNTTVPSPEKIYKVSYADVYRFYSDGLVCFLTVYPHGSQAPDIECYPIGE